MTTYLVHGISAKDLRRTMCGIVVADAQEDGHVHLMSWADVDCPECRLSKDALFFVFDMREDFRKRQSANVYSTLAAKTRMSAAVVASTDEQMGLF